VNKLAAVRAYRDAMIAASELHPEDPALAVEAAAFAAMELNHQLDVGVAPLLGLVSALEARRKGRLVEWLKPGNVGGTSALGPADKGRRAVVIATALGLHRRGTPMADADEIVAAALNRASVSGLLTRPGRLIRGSMVAKWRERARDYGKPEHLEMLIAESVKLPPAESLAAMTTEIARLQ
jgi:hypothetical protein